MNCPFTIVNKGTKYYTSFQLQIKRQTIFKNYLSFKTFGIK
ncbi:hypothetical protein FCR2A7T_20540 [Flavobacterium cauense R2A-7]|nr:hypothetical protein FCR2A7T_20540 [Flavobacterium cauense R2A-7]